MKNEWPYLWAKEINREVIPIRHDASVQKMPGRVSAVCWKCSRSVCESEIEDKTACPLCGFTGLKCFKNDVIDWIIAETPEEATKIFAKIYGEEFMDDLKENGDEICWGEEGPSIELTINDENWPEGSRKKTVAEWIKECGRGLLCSTEY